MPWKPEDATHYNEKATTKELQKLWAKTANAVFDYSGKSDDDAADAIKIANSAVDKKIKKDKQRRMEWL